MAMHCVAFSFAIAKDVRIEPPVAVRHSIRGVAWETATIDRLACHISLISLQSARGPSIRRCKTCIVVVSTMWTRKKLDHVKSGPLAAGLV